MKIFFRKLLNFCLWIAFIGFSVAYYISTLDASGIANQKGDKRLIIILVFIFYFAIVTSERYLKLKNRKKT